VTARRGALLFVLLLAAACSGGGDPANGSPEGADSPARRPELAWQRLTPAPSKRTEVTAAALGDRVFVMGGFAESEETVATVEIYDVAADSWRQGPDLPAPVNHAMSASLDDNVYLFGGYLGPGLNNPTASAHVLRDGRWETLPPMLEVRAAAGAAVVDGRIFIAGGVGPDGLASTTLVFDPATNEWSTSPGLPTPREHLGVASDGKRVVVIGGRTGGSVTNLAATEAFDPISGSG
jgi:N-acetylneuraminic acid mutarotase